MGRYATLTADLPPEYHAAHPICVAKKVIAMGYSPLSAPKNVREEAAKECIQEGKLHGIYKLFHLAGKKA